MFPASRPAFHLDKNRYPFWLLALLLGAVVFLLYSVSLGHNFFFDEENIILNNPTIRSLRLIPEIFKHGYFYFEGRPAPQWDEYYRPLTSITFALDYFVWGVNPLGYNLSNLFLHVALCILYFRLLERLLSHRLAAFLAALLYGVHTIHTEAVTYTASRGDVLGIVLMLASMLFYIKRRPMRALLCYGLALFSKETMILLPFYILALDLGFVKSRWRDLPKNTGPFFLVMVAFWFFRKFLCPIPFTPLDTDLHAMLLRMLGMGDGILQYLRALIAPEYFKAFSDVPALYGFDDPLLWTAVTVGSLLLAAWLFTIRRMSLAFLGMTILLMGLVPHFQIVKVYPKWAEHYICISSLGLFLLLGILVRNLLESPRKILTLILFVIYLPFLVFISTRTWQRNETYNDTLRYYELLSRSDTPYRFYGYQQLARNALERARPDAAYVYLNIALQQEYRSETTHELLGHYYVQKNKPVKALREFKLAYLYSAGSTHELQLVGGVLMELRRPGEAAAIFHLMHRISPESLVAYTQLMNAYELLNQPANVHRWADSAFHTLKSGPGALVPVRMALARFDYRQGRFEEARQKMKQIAQESPQASGNTDLARLCLGQISAAQFQILVDRQYVYFKNSAPAFTLMAAVLNGDKPAVLKQLHQDRARLLKLARKNPLISRELRVAERFVTT